MKWEVDGDKVIAWVSDSGYWCTNEFGDGVFFVNLEANDRKQYVGTCQFSVRGVSDKKAKLRRWINQQGW